MFILILTTSFDMCVYGREGTHVAVRRTILRTRFSPLTFTGFQGLNPGGQTCAASPSAHRAGSPVHCDLRLVPFCFICPLHRLITTFHIPVQNPSTSLGGTLQVRSLCRQSVAPTFKTVACTLLVWGAGEKVSLPRGKGIYTF